MFARRPGAWWEVSLHAYRQTLQLKILHFKNKKQVINCCRNLKKKKCPWVKSKVKLSHGALQSQAVTARKVVVSDQSHKKLFCQPVIGFMWRYQSICRSKCHPAATTRLSHILEVDVSTHSKNPVWQMDWGWLKWSEPNNDLRCRL